MSVSDAKWKKNRIFFDLAAAYKDSDGKVSLDDAVVIAATPAVAVDYLNCDESQLSRIMHAMKLFLKSRSRFRSFTKAGIAEGLRLEWLPTLEDDDKIGLLTDIKLITDISPDSFIEVNSEMLRNLTATEHPDHERYGSEPYSPSPTRTSRTKRPKMILTSVERDANLASKLKPYIEWYKNNWEDLQSLEKYKWQGLKKFHDNFNLEAKDFALMFANSFDSDFNLLATGRFYNPLGGIKKVAKFAPDEMRDAFVTLFNEEINLASRVETFINKFDTLYNRLLSEGKIRSTNYDKQSERSVSVYLGFYYPTRYFLYKYSLWQDAKNITDMDYPSLSQFESKLSGYQLICEQIREVLMLDGDLLTLLNKSQPDDCSDGHLLTQDFLYSIASHFVDFYLPPRDFIEKASCPG